jgi:hypothetical protein
VLIQQPTANHGQETKGRPLHPRSPQTMRPHAGRG